MCASLCDICHILMYSYGRFHQPTNVLCTPTKPTARRPQYQGRTVKPFGRMSLIKYGVTAATTTNPGVLQDSVHRSLADLSTCI